MKKISAAVLMVSQVFLTPLSHAATDAETIAQLRQQVAALLELKARLEDQLKDANENRRSAATNGDVTNLDKNLTPPKDIPQSERSATAIEQALMMRGFTLPQPGRGDIAPEISWSQSKTANSYSAGASLRVGLSGDFALGIRLPYERTVVSDGTKFQGAGDPTVSISKLLSNGSNALPPMVATLSYTNSMGFASKNTTLGGPSYGLSLSSFKAMDPLVLFGSVFYQSSSASATGLSANSTLDPFAGTKQAGINAGVSLAVTPESSIDLGLDISRRLNSYSTTQANNNSSVYGAFNVGASFLVTRNTFLYFLLSKGVTQGDAPLSLSVSLPYRF